MTNGEDNVKIRMRKDHVELEFRPAKLSDKGTCTCHAIGQGGEDSADIRVGGEENEVTITPKSTEVTCRQADDAKCTIEFDVTSKIGNPKAKDVKFWSLKDGQLSESFNMVQDGNTFIRSYGKWRNPRLSGQYVAVVTLKGKTYQSEPVTFTVLPKAQKAKG